MCCSSSRRRQVALTEAEKTPFNLRPTSIGGLQADTQSIRSAPPSYMAVVRSETLVDSGDDSKLCPHYSV